METRHDVLPSVREEWEIVAASQVGCEVQGLGVDVVWLIGCGGASLYMEFKAQDTNTISSIHPHRAYNSESS